MKKWNIDRAHSQINFGIECLGLSIINGSLQEFRGSLEQTRENDFAQSKFYFQGLTSSIFTGHSERDNHLCSADFFDTQNYSQIKFIGHNVERIDETHYFIAGALSIKDCKKAISLTAYFKGKQKSIDNSERLGFEITGLLRRSDFNLNWNGINEDGVKLIGESVQIHIQLQLKAKTN